MGMISDLFEGGSAKAAAENNRNNLASLSKSGTFQIQEGLNKGLTALDKAGSYYDPVKALGTKYNAAGDMALNALGINGASGNAAATGAFQAGPGYDFKVNSALDALDRRAASRGMLASGNTTNDTLSTVTGLADQAYGDWQNRLYQYAGLGANETNVGAQGSAAAESAKAPLWANAESGLVDLGKYVTGGINSQNTQAANAQMAGAGNAMNLGIKLAQLATSAATGMPTGGGGGGFSTGSPGGTGGGLGGLY